MAAEILVARDSAAFEDAAGTPVFIHKGMTARAGHPVLKGREYLFEPLVPDYELPDEPEPAPAPKAARGSAKASG